MSEYLNTEIARGLWWFMLSLLGGVAICFVFFSYFFERRVQRQVTHPISELSKQITNPKEFMAARNKAIDPYARKSTMHRGRGTTMQRSTTTINESTFDTEGSHSSRPLNLNDSMNGTRRGSTLDNRRGSSLG